jgi:hypothetical protein
MNKMEKHKRAKEKKFPFIDIGYVPFFANSELQTTSEIDIKKVFADIRKGKEDLYDDEAMHSAIAEKNIEKVKKFEKEIYKYDEQIFLGIKKLTGLEFEKTESGFLKNIHVAITDCGTKFWVNPLTIGIGFEIDEFLGVLFHQILHRLFISNKIPEKNIFKKMFPNEHRLIRENVLVHAILKYIYLNILKQPNRLKKDIQISKKTVLFDNVKVKYSRVWEIVNELGYENIIKDFKKL